MGRWDHVYLPDLVRESGVELHPQGEDKWVGPHPHRHESKSGGCLVVWARNWWCSSCKAQGDIQDWLVDCGRAKDRNEADTILAQIVGPAVMEWEAPVPFPEFQGPPFPVEALPERLRRFVEEDSEALQVPLDLTAGLVQQRFSI